MKASLRIEEIRPVQGLALGIVAGRVVRRTTGESRHRIPAGDFLQQRKDFIPQAVAHTDRLPVAGILPPSEFSRFQPSHQDRMALTQQRTDEPQPPAFFHCDFLLFPHALQPP